MKHVRRMWKKLIRKIFGHKGYCCENLTWRCSKCPLEITMDEARRLKEKADKGYISIKEKQYIEHDEVVIPEVFKRVKEERSLRE